ncbi:MAG: PP2C family protein-serine/threonine phosphatase [Terracidiphilus sp.]
MALGELWKQFEADARLSYRLYSQEVGSERKSGTGRVKHFLRQVRLFFWAIVDKLTPARRILLLAALIMMAINLDIRWEPSGNHPGTGFYFGPLSFSGWGELLVLTVLVLEVTDRVVMKRDLQIAKEIQSWLLPASPPAVPGLEIAFQTRPANTVAGDYYDVFQRPGAGGTYLIAIADVAGKSVPAAMLMATYQASLKTLAARAETLTDLAASMNNYACGNSQNGRRFTTTFIGEYAAESRQLKYVNAGHNPPMLMRQNGSIERLSEGGIPLGILQDAQYASGTTTIASGDWLAIFTDGATEAENTAEEEYSEGRLVRALYANATAVPQAALSAIMMDINRFVGAAPQHDDITLMLIKAS